MKYRAEITSREQLNEALALNKFEYIYAPMEFLGAETRDKPRIIAVPPVFLGGNERRIADKLRELKQAGFKGALAHTLGHIELIKSAGLNAHGGFRLNITNSLALKQYGDLGLADGIFSIEMSFRSMREVTAGGLPLGIMAYGYLPLMLLRRCPIRDGKLCGKSGCNSLTDRLGNRLQTYCHQGEVEVLNPIPLVLSRTDELTADFAVLRFTGEPIFHDYSAYEHKGKFTRGLYGRAK
jgi:putative protease